MTRAKNTLSSPPSVRFSSIRQPEPATAIAMSNHSAQPVSCLESVLNHFDHSRPRSTRK